MAWEKEFDEVDKALGVHRIGLVNRAVTTINGQPQRHLIQIVLGTGADGESCPHCGAQKQRKMALGHDGALTAEHGEVKPHEIVADTIRSLEEFHGRMERYARRHGAPIYGGPKKR